MPKNYQPPETDYCPLEAACYSHSTLFSLIYGLEVNNLDMQILWIYCKHTKLYYRIKIKKMFPFPIILVLWMTVPALCLRLAQWSCDISHKSYERVTNDLIFIQAGFIWQSLGHPLSFSCWDNVKGLLQTVTLLLD